MLRCMAASAACAGNATGSSAPDVLATHGDEPHVAAVRADGVGVVEQSATDQPGDLLGGHLGVGVVEDGCDRDEHVGVTRL